MTSLNDIGQTTHFPESGTKQQQYEGQRRHDMNLSSTERNISIVAGALFGLIAMSNPLSKRGIFTATLGGMLLHRGMSGYCALYKALGVDTREKSSAPSAKPEEYFAKASHVEATISINRSPKELYDFWRDFENLPRFMEHIKEVKRIDEQKSHWVAAGPLGYSVEWDAEIINDEPGKLIAWRSIGSAEVDNAGSVRFVESKSGIGTDVHVVIDYIPPAGKVGNLIAKLLGNDPKMQVQNDLQKLKQMIESREAQSV